MKSHLAVAAFCIGLTLHAQVPLRLAGSTTVRSALEPRQAVIEKAVGRPLEFSGVGTHAGLLSLLGGSADIAMLSAPLEDVARVINQKTPGRVDLAQLHAVHVGEMKNVFIVNPRNRVRTLSAQQAHDVFTGVIANWRDVGGEDAPIVVLSLTQSGTLLDEFLRGGAITAAARLVPNATQIPVLVAQDRHAIGVISTAHARGQTSVLSTDASVVAHLYLVTKSEPTPDVRKVVEIVRGILAGSGDLVAGSR